MPPLTILDTSGILKVYLMDTKLSGKVKLSAAVRGSTLVILERFRKEAGLKTRSAALCEALEQWAKDYARDSALEAAVSKYGALYAKAAAREEKAARRALPLARRTRGLP